MQQLSLAPVIIFTYKRLDTLTLMIDSLQKCRLITDTDIIIFSDGPKNNSDTEKVQKVRDYILTLDKHAFKSITTYFSETNKGLAHSVITGVSSVFNTYDTAIVLEDDLVYSANFLQYMNECLTKYKDNKACFSVSGYALNIPIPRDYKYDIYFTMRHSSWGWGMWKDRWEEIDWYVSDYPQFLASAAQQKAFNKIGSDLTSSLKRQMSGKMNSWAIRANYHQFKAKTLTVYPCLSKLQNIGFGSEGTHTTQQYNKFGVPLDQSLKATFNLPDDVVIDKTIIKLYRSKFSLKTRLKYKILNLFR